MKNQGVQLDGYHQFVTVIIPVVQQEEGLIHCLTSFTQLQYPSDRFEILVVGNNLTGKKDDTCVRGVPVRCIHEPTLKNPYHARNIGINAAQGDLIVFAEAAWIVPPTWLTSMTASLQDPRVGCCTGEMLAFQPQDPFILSLERKNVLRQPFSRNSPYLPFARSSNAMYRKTVFDRIGAFNTDIPAADIELSWRMQRQLGLRVESVPEASVYYAQGSSCQSLFHQAYSAECEALFWDMMRPDTDRPKTEEFIQDVTSHIDQILSGLIPKGVEFSRMKIDLQELCEPFLQYVISQGRLRARLDYSARFWDRGFPLVSVVVTAAADEKQLDSTLTALTHQQYPCNRFEILVIDPKPAGAAQAVASSFRTRFPVQISYHIETLPGLCNTLNAGIRHASGEIIVLVAGDIDVGPDWLLGMTASYEASEVVCASGPIQPIWPLGKPTWLPYKWLCWCRWPGLLPAQTTDEYRWPDFPWGVNISFKKCLFDKTGRIPFEYCSTFYESAPQGSHPLFDWIMSQGHSVAFAEGALLYQKMLPDTLTRQSLQQRMFWVGRQDASVDRYAGADHYHRICNHVTEYLTALHTAGGGAFYTNCLRRKTVGYLYQTVYAGQQPPPDSRTAYRAILNYLAEQHTLQCKGDRQYNELITYGKYPTKKPQLRIALANYWHEMVPDELLADDPLFVLLSRHFNLTLSDDPDILFFSVFGKEHRTYSCTKVCYDGEDEIPPPWEYDFTFSFSPTSRINFFHPFFVRDPYFRQFQEQCYGPEIQILRKQQKSRFCAFIHSNQHAQERIRFCTALMRYKQVDCPGSALNNMPSIGNTLYDKLKFLANCKFTLAFENHSSPNYTTEKILHPLLVGSIPIYWGNPDVATWFNPDCFVNCHDYSSFERVIERIIEIDSNEQLYQAYLHASPYRKGSKVDQIHEEELEERLVEIGRQALASRMRRHELAIAATTSRPCQKVSTNPALPPDAKSLSEQKWDRTTGSKRLQCSTSALNLHLLTFGDSMNYHHALQRCRTQAETYKDEAGNRVFRTITCVDDRIITENHPDFWDNNQSFIQSNQRGYGYWIWKPYLLRRLMDKLEEESVILYMDAGCELNQNGLQRLIDYYNLSLEHGGVCFRLHHRELEYTKMDTYWRIMGRYGYDAAEKQLMATAFLLSNNADNRRLVEAWYQICTEDSYHYVDDSASILMNHDLFTEHRHDQSILSLLVKNNTKLCILDDETYWAQTGWEGKALQYPIWATRNRSDSPESRCS